MPFIIQTRYGAQIRHPDGSDIPAIVERLIRELETEEFDEPDNEHTQVSVSNGDWAVTVEVSGLMTLSDLSWITGREDDIPSEELSIRANSRGQAAEMLIRIAKGDIEQIRSEPWTSIDLVPPYQSDLFRTKDVLD